MGTLSTPGQTGPQKKMGPRQSALGNHLERGALVRPVLSSNVTRSGLRSKRANAPPDSLAAAGKSVVLPLP